MTGLDRDWRTARIIWTSKIDRRDRRGLWSTWLPDQFHWRVHLAGHGLHPRSWLTAKQGFVLGALSLMSWTSRGNYRVKIMHPGLWDGRPDVVLVPPLARPNDQLDLFGFGGFGGDWGGVGVCLSGEAAGTPRTPPLAVYGFVTPIVSLTSETERSVSDLS